MVAFFVFRGKKSKIGSLQIPTLFLDKPYLCQVKMFAQIDISRRTATGQLDQSKRSDLGQFFTPYEVARFMASLFHVNGEDKISLLDAGAGIGSLSVAFFEQVSKKSNADLDITAYELDPTVFPILENNLKELTAQKTNNNISFNIISADFIHQGILNFLAGRHKQVDYAILNPPYKKINSDSLHRRLLRKAGIETVNLYAAFVALSILMLKDRGEIVAIIPRSFCNGPYFKPFRYFLLERMNLKQIHIFSARNKAFKDDNVLQENVIIHMEKGTAQAAVKVSSSGGNDFTDYREFLVPFERIVSSTDPEKFIHIPAKEENSYTLAFEHFAFSLSDIGVEVSTGPIVDFRSKPFLCSMPAENTVPLIYPAHFGKKHIDWPKINFKKSNAIIFSPETQKQLYPAGFYTLVRRFSSKEEKRRIVARVLQPQDVNSNLIGFENHLNVFHQKKKGLPEMLALGLSVYLNSTLIDTYFRQFNGHTQVNATDLRLLKYPNKNELLSLGEWAKTISVFDQDAIDTKINTLL
jgi:adenine-specific DNA-methyltransferase